MSLNKLPTFHRQCILDYLPVKGTTTPMQLVDKSWRDIVPNEGHLDLSYVVETDEELDDILKHFQATDIKIFSIDLSGCPITDAGLELLASSHLPIQQLKLRGCRSITNKGLKHLTTLPLTEIDLWGCLQIKDAGIKHLAAIRMLTRLDLTVTDVTDKGLGYLTHLPLTNLSLNASKTSRFFRTFPSILFPGVPVPETRKAYTEEYINISDRWNSEIDVQDLRQKIAEKLPPIHPPDELDIIQSYVDSEVQSKVVEDSLAPHLRHPPQLRVFSSYVDSGLRSKIVEKALSPLIAPLPSIRPLSSPLYTFAKREMDTDPKFAIYFNRPTGVYEDTAGGYSPWTGTIEIYINSKQEELDSTCLLHELGHKAYDKIGWKTTSNALLKCKAKADILVLELDGWRHCDPVVAELLKSVKSRYSPEKWFEEYLVRMPEILTRIAEENPTRSSEWIEKRIKTDLPHLYEIYTMKFLPQLKQYNKSGRASLK